MQRDESAGSGEHSDTARREGSSTATEVRPAKAAAACRGLMRHLGAVLAAGLIAAPAAAVSIVGQWDGQWQTPGGSIQADFDFKVVGQTGGGAVQGIFSWNCTAGIPCSGLEIVGGTIDAGGAFNLTTVALVQPVVNIVAATYAGTAVGNALSGLSDGVNPFSANLISTALPPGFELSTLWSGTWRQPAANGITADFEMAFTSAVFDGVAFDVAGYFDWTCTSVIACGGREFFGGTLQTDRSMQLTTTGFGPGAFGLAPANYALLLYEDARLVGLSDGVNYMTAAAVPEPATWMLLAFGLGGVAGLRRRPATGRSERSAL